MPLTTNLATALEHVRRGRPIIITDGVEREHEADLFVPAAHATPEAVNTLIVHGRGLLCAALTPPRALALDLPLAVPPVHNTEAHGCQFTVSVDAAVGTTTGITAAERARTLQVLANPNTTPTDLRRPGHVLPIVAHPGGLAARAGHTEASVTLCAIAGLPTVGVICEILDADGNAARGAALGQIARRLNSPILTIADLMAQAPTLPTWPAATVARRAAAQLPTAFGTFTAHAFGGADGSTHLALTLGDVTADAPALTRLHSQCLTGDALHSSKCDCRAQLAAALAAIAQAGRGVLVYLDQEGRGIGLVNKIRAYALQDTGLDTVAANLALGLPADGRDYAVAADILHALGIRPVELLTNNPGKVTGLERAGITVTRRVPLVVSPTLTNASYLRAKAAKLGHLLP